MKYFGITVGDPCGIGPEITLKALKAHPEYQEQAIVFGTLSGLRLQQGIGYVFSFHSLRKDEAIQKNT